MRYRASWLLTTIALAVCFETSVSAGSFTNVTVDERRSVGYHTSLELDSQGNPHIAYIDNWNNKVKYAVWTGVSWAIETVDDTWDIPNRVSLALDASDTPHISYMRPIPARLRYATKSGSTWLTETVDDTEQALESFEEKWQF
ncbi:MAG: hypothetical protein OEN01_08925 [Candidatus Krumholzibacteria bacterium]|nr:hypothetical protein [Candidatus Krumholzibacteria bacterium]